MREMILSKLAQREKEKTDKPLLIVICGRPATLKSTVRHYIELLRFGLKQDELKTFEHDSRSSMLFYHYASSEQRRRLFPNLKVIFVEGYNTVPAWADKNNPDLVIEFVATDGVRLNKISSRGWGVGHTKELFEAPRILYPKIDLVIDTSNGFELTSDRIEEIFGG